MKKFQLLVILVIAALFRFYNNISVSLWHDEAFSALYITKYGWGEMMHRIILDVHPPLYYIVLRFWSYIFGHELLSLRAMSILFGVLTVWAGYLLVKRAFKNEQWALLAAAFLAINPFSIQYALEARMYTLGTFLALISCYLLIRALEEKRKILWFWYAVSVAAAAYTHYFLLFSLAAQALYWFYFCLKHYRGSFFRAPEFLWGLGAYVLSVILYLPWVPGFIEQNTRVQSGYWIGAPDAWAIPGTVWKIIFGGEGINRPVLAICTVVTVLLLIYFIRKVRMSEKWLIAFGLVVPFLGAIAISLRTSIYLDRYFVFASLFISLVLALAFAQISKPSLKRLVIVLFIAGSVFAFFKNWNQLEVNNLFFDRGTVKKPGMAKAAELVNEQAFGNDKIFVGSSFIFFTFQYYNETGIKPLLLSDRPVEEIPHYAGTAILTNDELQITRDGLVPAEDVVGHNNVWLVWTTGFGGSKPNVPGNWNVVQEQRFEDAPGFKGQIFVTQYNIR